MKDCYLCGVDSSTTGTGISIFKNAIYNDVLSYHPDTSDLYMEDKIRKMSLWIYKILDEINPMILVVEMPVVQRNQNTQRQLSIQVGVIFEWAILHDADFILYRPTEWRKLISPNQPIPTKREQAKQWSIMTVENFYNINTNGDDDKSDSILIGQARINQLCPDIKKIIKG